MPPLAVTSTNGWIRRLGGKRWRRLHRLVYVAAIGGVLHFLWLVKKDVRTPVYFAVVLALLLAARPGIARTPRRARARVRALRQDGAPSPLRSAREEVA